MRLHEGEVTVGAALARGLVTSKFPQWSNLVLTQVESTGTDSIIFRLGERMGVRFPRIEWAVDQIGKEFDWLSVIGPQVSHRSLAREQVHSRPPIVTYVLPWTTFTTTWMLVVRFSSGVKLLRLRPGRDLRCGCTETFCQETSSSAAGRIDDATWTRGKGWVMQQAVTFIPYYRTTLPAAVGSARERLHAVLAD